MLTRPRWLLHLEGAAILGLTLYLYHSGHYRWWLLAVLFLAPDLFRMGYLKDVRRGLRPIILCAIPPSPKADGPLAAQIMGYRLKYPTFFKDTHLERV